MSALCCAPALPCCARVTQPFALTVSQPFPEQELTFLNGVVLSNTRLVFSTSAPISNVTISFNGTRVTVNDTISSQIQLVNALNPSTNIVTTPAIQSSRQVGSFTQLTTSQVVPFLPAGTYIANILFTAENGATSIIVSGGTLSAVILRAS